MNIQDQIIKITQQAVKDLYAADLSEDKISLQETRKEFDGHFTLVTFPIIRFSKKSPEQTGQDIVFEE
jgi:arginyl-tRNA synthetase